LLLRRPAKIGGKRDHRARQLPPEALGLGVRLRARRRAALPAPGDVVEKDLALSAAAMRTLVPAATRRLITLVATFVAVSLSIAGFVRLA
jgi:hypothetical protein